MSPLPTLWHQTVSTNLLITWELVLWSVSATSCLFVGHGHGRCLTTGRRWSDATNSNCVMVIGHFKDLLLLGSETLILLIGNHRLVDCFLLSIHICKTHWAGHEYIVIVALTCVEAASFIWWNVESVGRVHGSAVLNIVVVVRLQVVLHLPVEVLVLLGSTRVLLE